jgi:hypothetical protein
VFILPNIEEVRHDLLLTIAVAIFILYSTGLGGPQEIPAEPVIIP